MTTILITGAGRGIGFELARQSLDKGWKVIGSVRSVEAQRELAQKLPQMAVLNFDVTDHKAIEKVANAFHSPIDEIKLLKLWRQTYEKRALHVFRCIQVGFNPIWAARALILRQSKVRLEFLKS